jgi:hypothetical protein
METVEKWIKKLSISVWSEPLNIGRCFFLTHFCLEMFLLWTKKVDLFLNVRRKSGNNLIEEI